MDWRAARAAWGSFRGLGVATRAFLLARMVVAPLGPMDAELRMLRGRVLSLGCGHGAVDRYVAEINPDVSIEGVDLDEGRVRQARQTEALAPRVRVRVADVTELDPGEGFDGALAIDVLHHVPFAAHPSIAAAMFAALKPGGMWLVKEMAPLPRRQYLFNRMHDRIVAGPDPISCRMPEDMAQVLRDTGFEIDGLRRLKRLRIYPQYLVVARRPG